MADENKIDFKWEYITHQGNERTERAKIFGGWLMKVTDEDQEGCTSTVALIFISDPGHIWGK